MAISVLEFDPELVGRLSAEAAQKLEDQPPLRRAVINALNSCWRTALTPCQRRYLDLYYHKHMTMRDIAAQHGVTVATVSRTLKRARIRLRQVLQFYLQ